MDRVLLVVALLVLAVPDAQAQRTSHFDTRIESTDSGVYLMATPYVTTVNRQAGSYGILACWKKNGERQSARRPMNSKLDRKGHFDLYLGSSLHDTITDVSYVYFDMDRPRSDWPSEDSCSSR